MAAADTLTDRAHELARLTVVRRIITAVAVTASALLQAFVIQAFVNPADLLPSGFTGIAVLVDRITSLAGVRIDTSLGMLALNVPVAILCWKSISHRFVLFSMMQVALSSLFLQIFHFEPLLDDKMLLVVFGGFISGISSLMREVLSAPANPLFGIVFAVFIIACAGLWHDRRNSFCSE